MNQGISANLEQIEGNNSLKASLAKLNTAYSNNQLDSYRALRLKDSFIEKTPCNLQWGPMMRV